MKGFRLINFGKWVELPFVVPLTLLCIAVAGYGLLINRLGYYWDDFPLAYIRNIYGSEGLVRYFSTNRPIWGLLYQITTNIFVQPWQWQVFALLSRWLSAVILWLLLREIWPRSTDIALWSSLLFLVYPGFKQQHISLLYSHMFVVLDFFLLSLFFNLKAINGKEKPWIPGKSWIWHGSALLLSLYNLLALEYFYALDLLRPILIWIALGKQGYERSKRVKLTIINWLPYLVLWIGVTIWRAFFFNYQTQNYQMVFFQTFRDSPVNALIQLIGNLFHSLWIVIFVAWGQIFTLPDVVKLGLRTSLVTAFLVVFIAIIMIVFYYFRRKSVQTRDDHKGLAGQALLVGSLACLLGGIPSWLIGIPPGLQFPSDRFTLPFMLGVGLIIAGLLVILPLRWWIKAITLIVLVSLAVGFQFEVGNAYRRDWETQRRFFWQLAWRIPTLEPGTTLMVNDLPVTYYSDNSLTAPLNWYWAPQNASQEMAYLLLYPSQRLGKSLASLNPGTPIEVNYLAAIFHGNTSQVVSVFYEPPACVRVLDKTLDSDNRMLTIEMQSAAALSSTGWIRTEGPSATDILPANLYSSEPNHGWCYYYERADLARQLGNWEEVAILGDQAFNLDDYPNDPAERFPFIEGYAHVGNWDRAQELSDESQSITPIMEPLLCRLWQRIAVQTNDSPEKDATLSTVYNSLGCAP
jgi:hypothetical protein